MNKHPVIKFILILVVSAAFGAAFSIVTLNNYNFIEAAISSVNAFLGQYSHILHVGVCLALSLIVLFRIMGTKRKLAAAGPDPDDEVSDKIEKSCNITMAIGTLALISNFFLFSVSCVYENEAHLIVSVVALLVFISFNTWAEVAQVNLVKTMEPRFKNTDPMSMKFHKDWENTSDEAEKYAMYKASFKTYRTVSLTILVMFVLCLLIQMTYPIGLMPFIVLAVLWAVQNLSYIKACSESNKK